jgi:hypothetical protein
MKGGFSTVPQGVKTDFQRVSTRKVRVFSVFPWKREVEYSPWPLLVGADLGLGGVELHFDGPFGLVDFECLPEGLVSLGDDLNQ